MDEDIRICSNCRFFEIELGPDPTWGKCHRNAPSPLVLTNKQLDDMHEDDVAFTAFWPVVLDDDKCGEWKPQTKKEI